MRRSDWGIVMERTELVTQRLANRMRCYSGVVLPHNDICYIIVDPTVSQFDHKIVVSGAIVDSDFKKKSFEFMFSIPQHRYKDNDEIVKIFENKFCEEIRSRLPPALHSTFK